MTGTWITFDDKVWPGNETGGDAQITDGYSVRFVLCGENREPLPLEQGDGSVLYAVMDLYLYGETRLDGWYEDDGIAKDSDGEPVIWLTVQSHPTLCTDPEWPGDTEVEADVLYDQLSPDFTTREAVDRAARELAERYLSDPELANRDIGWDGSWPIRS